MSGRLLILCPGQGGQHAGMFDLARTSGEAAEFIDRCGMKADPGTMFANRTAQPLVVAASLAIWQALSTRIAAPALVAGYSIGELTAYSVAGALAALDAVALAESRARLMDEAARAHPGQAMAALGGLPLARCRELACEAGYEIAIITGDDSCIAGGRQERWEELERAAQLAGARIRKLPVAVASHTSLMAEAVAPFARQLEAAAFGVQRSPVLSGIAATRITGKPHAVEHLARQLAQTIQWSACMDAAAEAGITVALELGPDAALSRMLEARHPGIACRSASEFRTLDGITAWVRRQLEQ
jgi:[acyl-carrier-protein] S-malonyltransferase